MNNCVTVISFLVRVPVLSEQITLQQPERTRTDGHTLTAEVEVCVCVAVTMVRRRKPTQSFDDGQLLNDGSFLHHPHHTESQRDCHHDRETLWDGSNSQTEGAKPVVNHQNHVNVVLCRVNVVLRLQSPDTDGEHVQDPLPLQPPHQHDDP